MKNRVEFDQLDGKDFQEVLVLEHKNVKDFVRKYLQRKNIITVSYMLSQILSLVFLFAHLVYAFIMYFLNGDVSFLIFFLIGGVFSFSLLVVVHELIHGLAYFIMGFKNISFGGNIRKFVFYAVADKQVVSKGQFTFVALAPFIVVFVVALFFYIFFFSTAISIFYAVVFSLHVIFCSGDFAMLSFLYTNKHKNIYTADDVDNELSYFYEKTK